MASPFFVWNPIRYFGCHSHQSVKRTSTRTSAAASMFAIVFALMTPGLALPADPPKGQRVFTAGHSFHIPMIGTLDQIAKSAGITTHSIAGIQMLGGSTVTEHWNLPDNKDQARKAIKTGTVDVLTVSPHIAVPDEAINKFTALLLEHNPTGRVTVQVSWLPNEARVSKLLGYKDDPRDQVDPATLRRAGAPLLDKIREQVKAINDKYAAQYKRQVVFLVPVGEAVYRLRERIAKGEVPGVAKQSDLFADSLGHGKSAIGVLTGYCHFAVIYGQSPVGLPVPDALKKAAPAGDLEKLNAVLQEIAWAAVRSEPLSGVKAAAGEKP